jgi:hypothetical protein
MTRTQLCVVLLTAIGSAASGCATRQSVSLACVPKNVSIYVDGRLIDGAPDAVKLSKHEPHAIFLKGGGYQSQMLVFESRERDGEPELDPADLCSRVKFIAMQPEVKIELEPGAVPER